MPYPRKYDKSLILQLAKEGKTDSEIAAAVGCSKSLVVNYRNKAKIRVTSRNQPWTKDEQACLERLLHDDDRREDIARFLKRTLAEVLQRMYRTNLSREFDTYHDSSDKKAIIWEMISKQVPRKLIAQQLGCHISLVNRYASQLPNKYGEVGVAETREYVKHLLSKGLSIEQVAQKAEIEPWLVKEYRDNRR